MSQSQALSVFTVEQLDVALREEQQVITALLAGSPVKPQKLMASVLVEVDKQPKLRECSIKSVIGSAVEIARMGLEIGGSLGDAWIIPYGKTAQPQVGYKGYINLVLRSGFVRSVDAQAVYENDEFDYGLGSEPFVEFKPCLKGSRGEILCFFAVATMADGVKRIEIMTLEQVIEIRDKYSQGYRNAVKYAKPGEQPDSPWAKNFAEMGRKTVIRRITKQLPKSAALIRADELEEAFNAGEPIDVEQVLAEGAVVSDPAPGGGVRPAHVEVQRADGSMVDHDGVVTPPPPTGWTTTPEEFERLKREMIAAGVKAGDIDDVFAQLQTPNKGSQFTWADYCRVRTHIKGLKPAGAEAQQAGPDW